MRIFEDIKAKDCKLYTLYINTSGYAYIEYWPTRKRKYFFPNDAGFIFINGRRINLKRLIYQLAFPYLDLREKVVTKLKGNTYSIFNLFALTKNQLRLVKKHNLKVEKNECTGECKIKKITTRGRN